MAVIDKWLLKMRDWGASDLHLTVGAVPKMRINGEIRALKDEPLTNDSLAPILREIVSEEQLMNAVGLDTL